MLMLFNKQCYRIELFYVLRKYYLFDNYQANFFMKFSNYNIYNILTKFISKQID
jgi:hypothetical protein